MFGCSDTLIYNREVRDESSGQPWDSDRASWSKVRTTSDFEPAYHELESEVVH